MRQSLYERLYQLLRNSERDAREDFLTEIFASLLEEPGVLKDFCSLISFPVSNPTGPTIKTQYRLDKLEEHDADSRLDIAVFLNDGSSQYAIFIESKLDSGEGTDQLKRYADHLYQLERSENYITALVYITDRYDPKIPQKTLAKGSATLFRQLRWGGIYTWLKDTNFCSAKHLLEYMEGTIMNKIKRIESQGILSLQELPRLWSFLEDCVGEEVDDKLKALFGTPGNMGTRASQVNDHGRFMKYVEMANKKVWVGCGFYPGENGYPLVTVEMAVGPKITGGPEARRNIVSAMNTLVSQGWVGYDLETPGTWAGIRRDMPIQNFLAKEDHVAAIRGHFVENLQGIYEMKSHCLECPWK